ncbi:MULTISPECIES: hypothetical protein [Flavobacteriaceae]|jgi:hypothetical protein|uniref:Uncharacterized protein n=4 Tax=Flavobacteriaceae TaxID=49546 RepID=A0A0Q9Z9B2_9FLAO|nr:MULTISPECIES: hypothetical protein [Flavobacteriaceae]ADF54282.1 hypothetical protein ZPR_3978 [Zunongwangia profunda SM-A87]APS38598.1 hypothetical protein AO058_06715 [Salegentibacter sp. T436]KRG28649.1 hypothetical protein APR42_07710 [Salegentibacter mishustinae]MBO2544068.1 hypothetical protein [Salegentibacter sp. BDJ18]MDT0641393.1 hypothetical protein [Zunongwangia sp. F363]|tara:strand:+ start:597 stop:1292 length:696 start_codon:yes stop_codon:yes gene_type:complete
MNNRLNNIIKGDFKNFDRWIEVLNRQRNSLFDMENQSEEELTNLTYETSGILGEIADLAIEYGNFKDDFDTSKMYVNLYGPSLIIESKKTGGTYYLATDLEGIYLTTSFLHADNLKNMSDSFWLELFKLKKFSGFEYEENSFFSIDVQRKYPELFHTYKDTLFLMFRKFFLSHTEKHNDIDIGNFKVKWKPDEDFSKMISEICLAFKSMYKMDYQLWKITDLRMKKNDTRK